MLKLSVGTKKHEQALSGASCTPLQSRFPLYFFLLSFYVDMTSTNYCRFSYFFVNHFDLLNLRE